MVHFLGAESIMPIHYVRLKRGISFFRRRVPLDLRQHFGTYEIVRSLGRVPPREARWQAAQLWLRTEQIFMALRQKPILTPDDLERVAAAAKKRFNFDSEMRLAAYDANLPQAFFDRPQIAGAHARGLLQLLQIALRDGNLKPFAQLAREFLSAEVNKKIEVGSSDERLLARTVMNALAATKSEEAAAHQERPAFRPEDLQIIFERQLDYDLHHFLQLAPEDRLPFFEVGEKPPRPDVDDAPAAAGVAPAGGSNAPQEPLPNRNKKFRELWESFTSFKRSNDAWKVDGEVNARGTRHLWIDLEGDLPPEQYKAKNVQDFLEQLKLLPSKYAQDREFKAIYEKHGARALIAQTKAHACARTTAKTRNKHIDRLNQFFEWCATDKGEALPRGTTSICDGYHTKIRKPKVGQRLRDDARRIYEPGEIKQLLTAPLYLGCKSAHYWKQEGGLVVRSARYWLPLIGLLHGTRLNEPVVLKVKHVRETLGIWYFDLLDKEVIDLIKNDAGSPRQIPLHKDLIALGFLEARVKGRNPEARLFPEVVSYSEAGRDSGPISSWYLNFRRSRSVDDANINYHTFRHTVVTLLNRAGVLRQHIEELVGHESDVRRSAFHHYNHGMLIEELKKAVDKVNISLDVSALNAAVSRSDAIDRSAAWPDLIDPDIVPKPRRKS